jgi:SIR2-like domain
MEFLRSDYEEYLDQDGDIEIAGESFLRSKVLRELAPEPYEQAFYEWLQARKQDRLEKASEILARHDNENRFEQLERAFRGGGMLPFVGAGMSVRSGYPAWTPFLFKLCEESHLDQGKLATLLNSGGYEEAAQLLHDDMGAELFNEQVEVKFAQAKRPIGVISYIPWLFPNSSVLTTNFDGLLEVLYNEDTYGGFDRVLSGKGLGEVVRQIAGGSRLLVKLHGDCRQVTDRVLLNSEYEVAYTDEGTVSRFFSNVLFGRAILFLGCSLTEDRTIGAMKKVVAEVGAAALPRHYALLPLKPDEDRVARKRHLARANIFPIWYEDGDHDESIEALFLKLMEDET